MKEAKVNYGKFKYPIHYSSLGKSMAITWRYGTPAFDYIKDEVKGCEGSKWNPEDKIWTVKHPNASIRNRHVLGLLTGGTMEHTDPSGILRYYSLPKHTSLQEVGITLPDGVTLRDYQITDVLRMVSARRILLEQDMGLGKTLQIIIMMHYIKTVVLPNMEGKWSTDMRDLFWVVGPRGALQAWTSQLKTWKMFGVTPQLIMNSPQAIRKAMDRALHPPILLNIDESANFKNAKAQRTQLVLELVRLMANTWNNEHIVVPMTGTPVPKSPVDLWAPTEICCPGFIKEKSAAQLTGRLAHTTLEEGAHGSYQKVTGWNTNEISAFYERLKNIRIIRSKSDVAKELPDKIYETVKLDIDPATLSAAKVVVSTMAGAQALISLRQISDGFLYEKDEVGKRIGTSTFASPKLAQLEADLDELTSLGKTRLIVWAGFQGSIDAISRLCHNNGWNVIKLDGRGPTFTPITAASNLTSDMVISSFDTSCIQDEYQTRNLDKPLVFVGNPDAAGEGLTLTKSNMMIFYSNTFKGDKRRQAEDRIHRIGMDENVAPLIKDYIHLPTDELVLKNLRMKKDLERITQGELLDALAIGQLETQA